MLRVVVDARMLSYSGIGRYLSCVLPLLFSCSRFSFSLVVFSKDVSKFSFLRDVEMLPITGSIYSIREQIELATNISKCDLFWSPHFNVPLFPIRARRRLVTIHDVYHLANSSDLSIFKRSYAKMLLSHAVTASDKIITVSNFSKFEILKYTDTKESKITVIHNGLDSSFFKEGAPANNTLQSVSYANLNSPYFLYVGNLKKHKNVELLLHAYECWLSSVGFGVKLVLVGKEFDGCPVRDYIKTSSLLSNRVIIYSNANDDELKRLYKNAIALVMPSLYEGFGLTPLEAMASGCPAIVSRAASLPEVCGDAASYFDPTSSSDLLRAMKHVVYDSLFREQLIEKGCRKVQEYCWKKAAEKHIKVFDSLFIN